MVTYYGYAAHSAFYSSVRRFHIWDEFHPVIFPMFINPIFEAIEAEMT